MSNLENEPRVPVGDGTITGSVTVEKTIHEVRSKEVSDAVTVHPTELTIFFGGNVNVFEGIPADKIEEIIRIATASAKSIETKNSTMNISPVTSPALNRAPSFSSTSTSPVAQSFPMQPLSFCRSAADLPIARRHSLQRFLEKRRDRLVNKNPYPTSDIKKTDVQPDNNASVKREYPTA